MEQPIRFSAASLPSIGDIRRGQGHLDVDLKQRYLLPVTVWLPLLSWALLVLLGVRILAWDYALHTAAPANDAWFWAGIGLCLLGTVTLGCLISIGHARLLEQPVRFPTAPIKGVAQTRLIARHGRNRLAIAIPWRHPLPALVRLSLLIGTVTIAVAYANASISATQTHFHLFWLGVLAFIVPAFLRLCAEDASRSERLAILAAIGLFNYLPKFLRSPLQPIFSDELAHWRQAEVIYHTGHLFAPNPLNPILQSYPGLQALTVPLRDFAGLSTYAIATILLALLHVVALVGIVIVAERLTHTSCSAGLAAFLFSLNPGFMFFDAQFAYESLAIVFFVWIIAAVVSMHDGAGDRRKQRAWCAVALVLSAACIVTHHLTTYILALVLALITAVAVVRAARGRENWANPALSGVLALFVGVGAVLYVRAVAPDTARYFGPILGHAITNALQVFSAHSPARTLFAMSATPWYERVCAYLSPVIMLAGAALGLWALRHRRPSSSTHIALILFGFTYFASLPLVLSVAANEGARRSWSFTYLGLSLLIAPAIVWVVQTVVPRYPARRVVTMGGLTALASVVLIGNVAMHTDETYRFPGAMIYGSDTRTMNAELIGTTQWFRATQGANRNIVADRSTEAAFASYGMDSVTHAWESVPVWDLYFSTQPPSKSLLYSLYRLHYQYLVVDTRMAQYLPRIGFYIVGGEPLAHQRKAPVPRAALAKYEHLPLAIKIYQSDDLNIYRLDYERYYMPKVTPKQNQLIAHAMKTMQGGN